MSMLNVFTSILLVLQIWGGGYPNDHKCPNVCIMAHHPLFRLDRIFLNIRNILACSLLFRIIWGTNLAKAFHVFFMALTVINSDFFLLSYLH